MTFRSPHRFLAQAIFVPPVRRSHAWLGVAAVATVGVAATCAVAQAPQPEKAAAGAQAALAKGKVEKAIGLAEQAVAADPKNAAWRVVLGDAYLRAGRFASARQAYDEALQLGNDKGRTALALALMQIAQGQLVQASDTLSAYRDSIPAGDYGLALALTGQTGQGVAVLADALRQGDNSPKIRQNLAYAFALDGKWPMARAMVEQDLPADKVDERLNQWALAGRPEDNHKRVAMLLGAPLRGDSGEPAALALAATPDGKPAHAAATPLVAPVLARAATTELPPLPAPSNAPTVALASTAPLAEKPAAPAKIDANADVPAVLQNIRVQNEASPAQAAPVHHVVPGTPVAAVRRPVMPQVVAPVALAAPRRAVKAVRQASPAVYAATGNVAVQLGAFATQDGAQRALRHYASRHHALDGHALTTVRVKVAGKTYFRVLATGFAGRSASAACHAVTAGGGACLVRADMTRIGHAQPVGYARNTVKAGPRTGIAPGFARRK